MNVELLSNMQFETSSSDIWGYVDASGNEYAIIGLKNSTTVVNITDSRNPVLVGSIPGPNSIWRDIKTFATYAYVVEDQRSSTDALQIIDLSNLPNSISLAASYNATFTHAHNLYIDVDNANAYVVGGNAAGVGGISILSLTNPIAPVEIGTYTTNYVHDIYVLNDKTYGSAIFEGTLQVIDVSNVSNPGFITEFETIPDKFTHNAWTTEDGRFIATTDEVVGANLKIWDISDIGNIELVGEYNANPNAIMHNVIIKDGLAYISYYTEGLRVVNISDPSNPVEIAFYDTWLGSSGGFDGAWGVYPFLPSGNILVSDIQTGLYVFSLCGGDGDVNNDGVLTPGDALCCFMIFLNGQIVPPDCDVENDCELIAGDVNCDGMVTPGDCLAIFQRFLDGLPPEDCFAQSGLLAKASSQGGPLQLSLNQRTIISSADAGGKDVVKIALMLDNPKGLDAFGLSFMYPADKHAFLGVERTSLTADWIQLDGQSNEPGKIIVGGFNDKSLPSTASGELFHLVFASKGEAISPTDFKITDLVDDFKDASVLSTETGSGDLALIPKEFKLHQNYPNPFNPETVIEYQLPEPGRVSLKVYTILGQHVRTLLEGERPAGHHRLIWDGKNDVGQRLASGVYLYRIQAGEFVQTRKVVLLK